MVRRRKTVDERRAEADLKSHEAWAEFEPKLRGLKSFREAQELVAHAPRVDTPGRPYYSNLGFFLGYFTAPDGASRKELLLYVEFIRRISREIKPEIVEGIVQKLNTAVTDRWF